MKCYFCLTEPDEQNSVYLDLLYVSLKSARQNTGLDLFVLYDGSLNGRCYEILKEFNVNIILHEFSHKQYLEKTYSQEYLKEMLGREVSYEKIAGTFMRFDIPFIEKEDEYVLYADIDVMFLKDFSHSNFNNTPYLAATSQFKKSLDNISEFNAGILYLNVKNMREISNSIFNMLKNGIRNKTGLFDQGYLNELCRDKFTIMPLEFNWKPYWGYSKDAYIVHLHGMKPGGNIQNSGFRMNEIVLYDVLKNHEEDISGYVYYLMLYYEILGRNGKEWLADFIALNFTTIIKYISPKKYLKKYKRYKKLNYILLVIIVFLMILLTAFVLYIK